MRAFVAIEVSDEIKNILGQIEAYLRYAGADVKWARPEVIHLTVKFLGEIDEKQCEDVKAALEAVVKTTAAFEMTLKDIGAFPAIEHPRVVWVGIEEGAAEITALASRIESSLEKLGFAREERPFSPHLTIGRVRSPLNIVKLKEKVLTAASQFRMPEIGTHKVTSVILYKSTLTPQGPLYVKLHEAGFSTDRHA
jgi:RNA 2',3'-cyclic 3'-phosphodiesterase